MLLKSLDRKDARDYNVVTSDRPIFTYKKGKRVFFSKQLRLQIFSFQDSLFSALPCLRRAHTIILLTAATVIYRRKTALNIKKLTNKAQYRGDLPDPANLRQKQSGHTNLSGRILQTEKMPRPREETIFGG